METNPLFGNLHEAVNEFSDGQFAEGGLGSGGRRVQLVLLAGCLGVQREPLGKEPGREQDPPEKQCLSGIGLSRHRPLSLGEQ